MARVLSSYWLSPRVSTAVGLRLRARSEVAFCLQRVVVPRPPLNEELVGSHAVSPWATTTMSPEGFAVVKLRSAPSVVPWPLVAVKR